MTALRAASAWRDYLHRYGGARWAMAGSVLLLILQSALTASLAFFVKMIFDDILLKKPLSAIFVPCGALLLFVALGGLLSRTARENILELVKRVIADLRNELLAKSWRLLHAGAGERTQLHSLIVHDTERVDVMSNAIVSVALPALLTAGVLLAALCVFSPLLLLATICVVPIALLTNRYLGRSLKRKTDQFHDVFETFSQGILSTLRRLPLTRAMGAEAFEAQLRAGQIDRLRRVSVGMSVTAVTYSAAQSSTTALIVISTLLVGGGAVLSDRMSLSTLAASYIIISQLGTALNLLWNAVPQIVSGHKSLIDIHQLLARTDIVAQGGEQKDFLLGQIEFSGIQFSYGTVPVLNGLDLHLAAGAQVAITGANGAGKSTLAQLLLGYYIPQGGQVLIDGKPIAEISLGHFRQHIGIVLQEPLLFDGTILENIAYGREADLAAVQVAAERTRADQFIRSLPDGYDTQIGTGGTTLSGGQSQLIAVTRALLGEPRLLILDEPTNHLDSETATALCATLRELPFSPTILLITHDALLAAGFERVCQLRHGKLLETGRHPRAILPLENRS